MSAIDSICVLGLGYIGLPTAAMFATQGFNVIGVDVNQDVIETLNNGDIHIHEPGLKAFVQAAFRSGNLQVSDSIQPAQAFVIAVPTPFQDELGVYQADNGSQPIEYKKADMSYVISAAEAIMPHLQSGDLVILESTSPPRTTVDLVAPILERSGLKAGQDFHLAYSPERVLPGQILKELIENARVIGGVNAASAEAGRALYAAFVKGEILLTDATTAEVTKLMENTYRDVNIALANEFSRLAEQIGFDAWEAIELANYHPRVDILKPGPGVGGHCISVDPWFLVEAAPAWSRLIHMARQVNDAQPTYVVELIEKAADGTLAGKRIAALGLTYKADVDDLRESPAVEVCRLLAEKHVQVRAYEPHCPQVVFEEFETANTVEQALAGADILLFLVKHQKFQDLNVGEIAELTNAQLVCDLCGLWQLDEEQDTHFSLMKLGANSDMKDVVPQQEDVLG